MLTNPLQALFVGLVDDGGLFAPGSPSMADVLARHRAEEDGDGDLLSDRLVVPVTRLSELLEAVGDEPLDVGLLVDTPREEVGAAITALNDCPATTVTTVEVPLLAASAHDATAAVEAIDRAFTGLAARVSVFVEIPLDGELEGVLELLTAFRLGAKVRCAPAPDPTRLADFLRLAVRENLPFKAVAGLDRALRRGEDHGFLNLLVALLRAIDSRPREAVVEALTSTDAAALAEEASAAGTDLELQARAQLIAVGVVDTTAPGRDLETLGLA